MLRPRGGLEPEIAHLAECAGLVVVGGELGAANRPAGMGNPRPALEIHLLQPPAPAAPVVGRAAEIAQASVVGLVGRRTDGLASTELLNRGFELEGARFRQAHLDIGVTGERQRQGDAGSTGTDDAKISLQEVIRRQRPAVDQHVRVQLSLRAHGQIGRALCRLSGRCFARIPRTAVFRGTMFKTYGWGDRQPFLACV
jgi:hypothetical protein